MNIDQLISPVPALLPDDSGSKALDIMEENSVSALPVVDGEQYLGLVMENELLDWKSPGNSLKGSDLLHFKPAIPQSSHPYEAMKLMHQMALPVMPVVDNANKFVGCITTGSVLKYIIENSGIDSPGGIIVLEILPRNYTLPEIARICENEDITIQNLMVHTSEQGMLEITLKLNRSSLDALVSSFERHNYHVKEVYGDNSSHEDIESKYNLLMNFINM